MGNVFLLTRGTNLLSHRNCLSVHRSKVIHTYVEKNIRLHKYATDGLLLYILYTTVMFPFFLSLLETKASLIIRGSEHS